MLRWYETPKTCFNAPYGGDHNIKHSTLEGSIGHGNSMQMLVVLFGDVKNVAANMRYRGKMQQLHALLLNLYGQRQSIKN